MNPILPRKSLVLVLGLTIVYKIIKEHQAEIAVDSEPGKGTTITLQFPIPQPERQLIDYRQEVLEGAKQ